MTKYDVYLDYQETAGDLNVRRIDLMKEHIRTVETARNFIQRAGTPFTASIFEIEGGEAKASFAQEERKKRG